MEVKNIPLNDLHEKSGAKMVPFAGFNMPVSYSTIMDEHMTVRKTVGIFDVSHMGEFIVKGPGAKDFLQKMTSNDIDKLFPGKAQYSCLPNDKGGIVDDLIVYMIDENEFMMVVNASNIDKDWDWLVSHNTQDAEMKNISDETCLFAVQGPKSTEAIQSLTPVDLDEIKFYHFETGEFAGIDDVIISGTGYTGSGGFELYLHKKNAEEVWNKIVDAGESTGIKPVGLGARDTLRLEKGFCLYGNDIDENTSPLEAGLGWITKPDTGFINAEFFKKQKEEGVHRKLVGFKMADKGIPRNGYEIRNDSGDRIGYVTSGTQSPMLGVGIGMGYVEKQYSEFDSIIYIVVRNKVLKATVVKLPFV